MARGAHKHQDRAADVLAIFGISGDLAKKMTFRALYRMERAGRLPCDVIGVAIDEWDDEALRQHAREAVTATVRHFDEEVFERLAKRLSYVQGDYADSGTFGQVRAALSERQAPVYYLEMPPWLCAPVVRGLGAGCLVVSKSVVIEKPFGHDLES